mmetsp:Transcript_18869/g.36000  ORF Transcript_18869/g.36000 Transcript_18869/m.36000 type:complete len:122 (+) Transcript_18869:378-743(+)
MIGAEQHFSSSHAPPATVSPNTNEHILPDASPTPITGQLRAASSAHARYSEPLPAKEPQPLKDLAGTKADRLLSMDVSFLSNNMHGATETQQTNHGDLPLQAVPTAARVRTVLKKKFRHAL